MSKVALVVCALAWAADAHADVGHSCVAMCDAAGRCTEGCFDGPQTSPSGPSAADMEAMRRDAQAQHDRVLANELAASEQERQHNARGKSDAGITAAKRHQWKLAAQYFEDAQRLDPNPQYAQNLVDARAAEAKEKRARLVAIGPDVPAWHPPERVTTKLSGAMVPSIDARIYLGYTLAYARDQAKEEAESRVDEALEIATPEGLFLRVEKNVAKLATTTIPEWLTSAADGTMSLDDAKNLPLKATAMIFNVGAAPGKYAQQLVEVGSAQVVVLKELQAKATASAEAGIVSLAAGLGADVKFRDTGFLYDQLMHAEMKKELEPYAKKALAVTNAVYDHWFK
jgi:tetratricopeptide (TPR) repeat protein